MGVGWGGGGVGVWGCGGVCVCVWGGGGITQHFYASPVSMDLISAYMWQPD